jgi:mRNA-degrading endonuclease YafQ of YafQ-DinJ toxin-antitoxin module
MSCKAVLTEEFSERLNSVNYSNIKQRIIEKIKLICEHPLIPKTYFLHGDLFGKRSFHVSEKIRIIYAYCKLCRRLKHLGFNNCQGCENMDDETVIFFTFGYHEEVY